jgi:hypothetical protein
LEKDPPEKHPDWRMLLSKILCPGPRRATSGKVKKSSFGI